MKTRLTWTRVADLRQRLKKRWERGEFLYEPGDERRTLHLPLRISLHVPTAAEMAEHFAELQEWIRELRRETEDRYAGVTLEWKEINHRQLGRNRIPGAALFCGPESVAEFLGTVPVLKKYRELLSLVCSRRSDLGAWAAACPFELLHHAESIDRLLDVVSWLAAHPRPGVYIRQLSIEGVNTKFIENNTGVLSRMLDQVLPASSIDGTSSGARGFERRYGFLSRPPQIRFRLLEPGRSIGGCTDLTIPVQQFCSFSPEITDTIDRIYVTENDINGLAFPSRERAMVIFGRGYHFSGLARAQWLQEKEFRYWGDVDTHGFAILSQFRSHFSRTRSMLMDRRTFLANRAHWGKEPSPTTANLAFLTDEEASLYDDLRYNRIGERLRLEQEFVGFDQVRACIASDDRES